mmetsp:Transcript_47537/g.99451  ORF Transcript_47537/g.99451 Transcript_47537/m.99451 type:complete len:98 (-) Transcript_47537:303-596(-)
MFMYGFAGVFLILLAVMLCITPNPQWMDPGDETPIGYGNPINTTQEIYSGAKLHPVQGKQLHFITGDQINAILKGREKHGAFFQKGDTAFRPSASGG